MLVAIRMFQVFPFDFSGYEFDWERVTRFLMVLGMIGHRDRHRRRDGQTGPEHASLPTDFRNTRLGRE
jgi:hypothetical protein